MQIKKSEGDAGWLPIETIPRGQLVFVCDAQGAADLCLIDRLGPTCEIGAIEFATQWKPVSIVVESKGDE